jgi:GTP cyclohydrolase FolE2
MQIDEKTGLITWTPKFKQLGRHDVEVQIESESGDTDVQKFVIQVKPKILSKCPASAVLDDNKRDLSVLREFRDNRLSKSVVGLSLVILYYTHGQEITGILYSNSELMAMAKELAVEIVSVIKSGPDAEIFLNRTHYLKSAKLLKLIQKDSSPGLSKSISFILNKLASGELLKEMRVRIN